MTGVGGAWADETFTIIDNADGGVWPDGSYSSDNGTSTWKGSWTSTSTTPQITVSADSWLLQNSTGYIGSSNSKTGTYNIKISEGYLITGYTIVFENVDTDGSHNQTITPNGASGVTASGSSSDTVTVTGLNKRLAVFTLTGENSLAKVTKFTINYVEDSFTWSSGVPAEEVGGSRNYYSTTWYLKLTSPNYNDVFFDSFTLAFASNGSADDDVATYLALTYEKFNSQNNHKANEFIAISSNSLSGHSSATANTVTFNFPEKVRLNGNETVYVCFVSSNGDGTYNLRKRGIAVKLTSTNGIIYICSSNTYTTDESSSSDYQCHYTCTYSLGYDYPQESEANYRIWSGINNGDKTSGGAISIAYMKITAPSEFGKFVQFDQFSLSLRNAEVVADTYLLFSTDSLTATGVTTSTEFEPSRFTAISTNKVPSANYGKVFTFTFDSDSYLAGGETYYVYMGTKQANGNFCLQKYGIFINHQMASSTGFQYSSALVTPNPSTNNNWQAIYYSSKCSFVDFSSVYTSVRGKSGTTLGKYSNPSYTQDEINSALSAA